MGEIVNLRREKKRRARDEAAQAAAENRVRFGRDAVQKAKDKRSAELFRSNFAGLKLASESGSNA